MRNNVHFIFILLTVEKVLFTDSIYSYKFLFYTSLGVLTNNKRKYTRILPVQSRTLVIRQIFQSMKQDTQWRLSIFVKLCHGFFIYPLKYLTEDLRPQSIPRGSCYQFCRSQPAKSNASFRRHYLDFLALFPLRNFTLPDGLTTRWQVDCYVTSVGNLERINSENICPDIKLYACIPKTDVFLTRFREHMIPST